MNKIVIITIGDMCSLLLASLLIRTRHHYEVGIEPTNADSYTGSVITVVSKANPEDPTVVLHGQGTALLTLEIFGGDISSAAITNLAIQLLLLVPFKAVGQSSTSQAAHCSRKWISHGQLPSFM